jgi:cystathionine gamma-synthase/methionine-gamma-lyase
LTHRDLDFETIAAHAGIRARVGETVSTVGPIVASTTFTGESIADVHRALEPDATGFAYARNASPTIVALETAIAALEGAEGAVAFGSGMGAINSVFVAIGVAPGDLIVSSGDIYGVTRGLFAQLAEHDIRTVYVDALNPDAVERAVADADARALYVESISNPLLRVVDLKELARIARRRRIPMVVDNTFATPYLCRPLSIGADIVVHSATKYIAGHGDVTAGLGAASESWTRRLRLARTVGGSVLSPFEAWLTLRGVRTLPVRMERQSASALAIAQWLALQDWADRVYYPGLSGNPQRELAERQFAGRFGGMLAFDVKANRKRTLEFIDALQLITPGTSLGDVESLVLYPPLSSHRTLSEEALADAGIGQGLVRMSIGLESIRDLIADLDSAAVAVGLRDESVEVGGAQA